VLSRTDAIGGTAMKMKPWVGNELDRLGIRAKLIALFVVIKVVPLVLLALLAWTGVALLGTNLASRTGQLASDVRNTVAEMGADFSKEAVRALDDRAREELERLTTDTARAVADFLHARDRDILLASQLAPSEPLYRTFMESRRRNLVDIGQWALAADGTHWEPKDRPGEAARTAVSSNAENRQDFHSRPKETVLGNLPRPMYHEITYLDTNGHEKLKVSATPLLPRELRDVSRRENTWCKAETYFAELTKLKPGEIYVSEVVGPYVGSRIIGPVTPESAKSLNIRFEPEKEAYAGRENPLGRRFTGIVRWATPVVRNGKVAGYVTLALDHAQIMSFTDNLMPTAARYTPIADAASGNYAFIWDHQGRSIAHPRHHSIVGFDPATGKRATPWLEAGIYEGWQNSGKDLETYLREVPAFDHQSRDKKPAKALTQAGTVGLDCRYLNFAPQCQGWHDLTEFGGSGSFLILWTGVWKLTTAAAIPYYTGQYGATPRGFGYVTIGANVADFHRPALATAKMMDAKVTEFGERMKQAQGGLRDMVAESMSQTGAGLTVSTAIMIAAVVAVAIWLASLLTRRVTGITEGLARIEGGELSFRFDQGGRDELGRLNESLNKMASSVQESFVRLDDARHQAEETSRLKSDFVGRVSHELRTPLNGILGFAELIREDSTDETIREEAETIHQSGQHLLGLVNDLLDVATIDGGYMSLRKVDFDLPALLNEVGSLHATAARQKGLELRRNFDAKLPRWLTGDPARLRQIINNLLSNAVKFTSSGAIDFAAAADGSDLIVGVRDTGPGIAEDLHEVIFERFRQASAFLTREHGGTGLGLALAREIADLMGGTIRVQSAPGEGAYFEFRMHLSIAAAPPADRPR
jgi:signal transduction histidine kinase